MTKKILVNYIGKSGGGPAFAFEFAKGLADNGCDVYVIMSMYVDNRRKWEDYPYFKDVYFIRTNKKSGKLYYAVAQIYFELIGKLKLKKHFKNIEFDYVITTMQHLWSIDISKILNKKKIVWICHDPIPHSGSGKIDTYLGNQFAKISDYTIVLTKKFIPIVMDRWGINKNKIIYMPHGRQCMYNNGKIHTIHYDKNKTNFLFFGYFREYKGLQILAQAYKKLISIEPNVSLTLAGSGDFDEYKDAFRNLPNLNVINRYIRDDEVAQFFDGPNVITVMPYLDATQSGVSLIAIEFGSVIIASDTGGLKEQLDDGNIGLYCIPGDSDDLCRKMVEVVNNKEIILEQKEKMRKYLNKIEWVNITRNLLNELGKR